MTSRLTLALALLTLAGCAEERAPISRVQPDALPKAFFVGTTPADASSTPEFYTRGSLVEVGFGAAQDGLFTATYAQPVSRVRFEITEHLLNARLSYELVAGSDGKGTTLDGIVPKTTNDGQVIASYPIRSHFDVRRAYNPTTGEELNVLEENATDRPWYERAYFRVDWSTNLATDAYDFDTLAMIGALGAVEYEPLAYSVTDPKSPDAPHFDLDSGYFDVTVKAFARPKDIDVRALGWTIDKYPACWLPSEFLGGKKPSANCNPVELTIRHSYRRVAPTDYAPSDVDGVRFQAAGSFYTERFGYDRAYGMVDDEWVRFASRYDLFERSHYYDDPAGMIGPIPCATPATTADPTGDPAADPSRDLNQNGTADECEEVTARTGVGGSTCDVFHHTCTLPLRLRASTRIPWYVVGSSDPILFESTAWATVEWDVAMLAAVRTAKLVECRRTGDQDCETKYPMWTGQQDDIDDAVRIAKEVAACRRANGVDADDCRNLVDDLARGVANERGEASNAAAIASLLKEPPIFVLCHSPVAAGDDPACGAEGLGVRPGDLRYNTINVIDRPESAAPWGIMVDAADPLSGEKVAVSINVWNAVTDAVTSETVDMVRYANGELATAAITNGTNVRAWARAALLSVPGATPSLDRRGLDERLAATTLGLDAQRLRARLDQGPSEDARAAIQLAQAELADATVSADAQSPARAEARRRMESAWGSDVEGPLMNAAMMELAGLPPGAPADGLRSETSPLALNSALAFSSLEDLREQAFARRGVCLMADAPEPSGISGLAKALARKFPAAADESPAAARARARAMRDYLRRRIHYGVVIHEMGHSVGHRHNFSASAAPLFYRPQYWQLRTKNGGVGDVCTNAVADGAGCVGPRYFDPLTAEETEGMIWMFQQSSVMDYPGDITLKLVGLGAYDFAATRFFYGDVATVYADPEIRAGTRLGVGVSAITDTFGGLTGIRYSVAGSGQPKPIHYSELQREYGLISSCYDVAPSQPAWWQTSIDGQWDRLLDGQVVEVDGATKRCRQMPVDYVAWGDLRTPQTGELGGGAYFGGPSVDPLARLRVPYAFASDRWADLGNASVYRHDMGADPYEIAEYLIYTQENRHIFDNFRRSRTDFSVRNASNRGFRRYDLKLLGLASSVGFLSNSYKRFAIGQGFSFDSLWPFIADGTARDNLIAASAIFDHFARQLARPEDGAHYLADPRFEDPVLHSVKDPDGRARSAEVVIPNGSTGYYRDVGFGGRPLENALSTTDGDFGADYTLNAGSYYDKINAAVLLSLSEDRFISQSRGDFYDARFRAAGMADVFPDGFRRLIANGLTGDRTLLAPHLAADGEGHPMLDLTADPALDPDAKRYPAQPIGWTSWWPSDGPKVCFPSQGRAVCSLYHLLDGYFDGDFDPTAPAAIVPVDPQIGWEVQKFLIAWTLAYIPANQQTTWIDMFRIYQLGANSAPEADDRLEWQDPVSHTLYYAQTFGTECLFGAGAACSGGKVVQRGIAARVLEYANELTARGYKLDTAHYPGGNGVAPGFNAHGRAMVLRHPDGTPIVKADPAIVAGGSIDPGAELRDCDRNEDPSCQPLTIYDNRAAFELSGYKAVPDYLWRVLLQYHLASPQQLALFGDAASSNGGGH